MRISDWSSDVCSADLETGIEVVPRHDADPRRDRIAVAAREAARGSGLALLGKWQDGRDPGRLSAAKAGRVLIEITLGAGIHAIGADAGLGDVEIDLHDPLLGPEILEQQREPGLKPFAEPADGLPAKGVIGRLLADRRAAPNDPAPLGILPHSLRDPHDVEAAMAAEFAVLDRK